MSRTFRFLEKLKYFKVDIGNFNLWVDYKYRFLHYFAFLLPLALLYYVYPQSFENTRKGRTYYLFYIFIMIMEDILTSSTKKTKGTTTSPFKTLSYIIAFLGPTLYVITAVFFGVNAQIVAWAVENDVYSAPWMPLALEYLVFALFHVFLVFLFYGRKGVWDYAISCVFLSAIGLMYTIDNVYPFGRFAFFQALVPTTVTLAEKVLNLLQYQTDVIPGEGTVRLMVWNASGRTSLGVAWPCAGIDSLILYTVTFALFLKRINISWRLKATYFLVGAIMIFLINVLRVVTIFQIAVTGDNFLLFHDLYGPLYSVTGIISYLFLILGGRLLWQRLRNSK